MASVQKTARESGSRIGAWLREIGEAVRSAPPPRERLGDQLETREEEEARRGRRADHYVIHKQAAWLCIFATAACGVMGGVLLAVLAVVVGG